MVAGSAGMVTGMRRGANGYAIERNTRYTDHFGGNGEMLKHLLSGRTLNGWTLRKILETKPDYEGAVNALHTEPYASTEYAIISGVKKGTIISRNPDSVAYVQTLGQHNYQERDDYIIMTNFDFFWNDVREYFDPTGGQVRPPIAQSRDECTGRSCLVVVVCLPTDRRSANYSGVTDDQFSYECALHSPWIEI